MNEFTYEEYRNIIRTVKECCCVTDYKGALNADSFCVIRHDVEWSLPKALKIAQLDAEEGVQSSFFIQFESDCYNPFSENSKEIVKQILHLGHKVGLHYRQKKGVNAGSEIYYQTAVMQQQYNTTIDAFSIHRPNANTQYEKIKVYRLLNAYGEKFFERTSEPDKAVVKYISDSKQRWKYGYPDKAFLREHKKIQLLMHPFSWSEKAVTMTENFQSILNEKNDSTKAVFKNEFTRYTEIEDEII